MSLSIVKHFCRRDTFQSRSVVTAFDHGWSLSQLPRLPANLLTARESPPALLHSDSSSTPVSPSHMLAPDALLVRASRSTDALARRQPSDFRRPRRRTFVAPHLLHTVPVQAVTPIAGVAPQRFLRPAPTLTMLIPAPPCSIGVARKPGSQVKKPLSVPKIPSRACRVYSLVMRRRSPLRIDDSISREMPK